MSGSCQAHFPVLNGCQAELSTLIRLTVRLSVRLMSSLCQACVPLCTIFLSGSCEVNYSLFPTLCQVLVKLFTAVWLSSCAVDVRPVSGSNFRPYSGSCQARHFLHMVPIIILNDNHFRVQPSQKIRGNY